MAASLGRSGTSYERALLLWSNVVQSLPVISLPGLHASCIHEMPNSP